MSRRKYLQGWKVLHTLSIRTELSQKPILQFVRYYQVITIYFPLKSLLFRNFNICLDKCNSNYECDRGQTCYNQQCLKSCNQENDCQAGQYCHEDHKVCHDFCLSDQSCSTGYVCFNSKCVDKNSIPVSALLVGGTHAGNNDILQTAEIIPNKCSVPSLPKSLTEQPSLVLTSDNNILVCGGWHKVRTAECFELKEKGWVHHSVLVKARSYATAITMAKGTFMFGGSVDKFSWEWLPSGSSTWVFGGSIPDPGFNRGCGVPISSSEILLIGGRFTEKRILKFNVDTNEWTEIDKKLQPGRYGQGCVLFKNNIIVSGGKDRHGGKELKSTQIINKDNLTLSYGSDVKQIRYMYGLVIANYNNQPTVLAFGGQHGGHTIEVWDPTSKSWSTSNDLRFPERKCCFGALSVPTHLLCP